MLSPARRSTCSVAGPIPGSARTGIGPSTARSRPGSISTSPSGLACSEAIFAISLEPAAPTEPVSPVRRWMSARRSSATASTSRSPVSWSVSASTGP